MAVLAVTNSTCAAIPCSQGAPGGVRGGDGGDSAVSAFLSMARVAHFLPSDRLTGARLGNWPGQQAFRRTGAFFSATPVLELERIFGAASYTGTNSCDNATDRLEGFRSRLDAVSLAASRLNRNSRSILSRALLLLLRHRVVNITRKAKSCRTEKASESFAGEKERKLRAA